MYGADGLLEFSGSFWSVIRREVLFTSREAGIKSALETLGTITQTIAQHPQVETFFIFF